MKDLFSAGSESYARYRPTYPAELYDWLLERVPERRRALDCATGNGQAAVVLAKHFAHVEAIDISRAQLDNAVPASNIRYRHSGAEATPFPEDHFDLATVAQAFHWMDAPKFCAEMRRVCRPGALMAAWSYKFPGVSDPAVNRVIRDFYDNFTAPYWEPERAHVDNDYANLAWDFDGVETARFEAVFHWSRANLLGYFSTWSATRKYIAQHGESPVPVVAERLESIFPAGKILEVRFPLFLKAGRVD